MDERPIWTAGMEAIDAALTAEALDECKVAIFRRWQAEVERGNADGDA